MKQSNNNQMIRYNFPHQTGHELKYIQEALEAGRLAGDGPFTKRCHEWLEDYLGCHKALLTHSCTAALEMAMILAKVSVGDEVIMPSYTFVSTANAAVLRGGIPVFVDIDAKTLNIDPAQIEQAITPRTKAICVVHYAGVACEMDEIMGIANRHGLIVIEDAAQAIASTYKGRKLGTIGHLATLSFHETKNVVSGEGGALLINDESLIERAEIIREKGTNRSRFFRGQVDKYTWVDIGSSYLPSEIIAAFLLPQLQQTDAIIARRLEIWHRYRQALATSESQSYSLPQIPTDYQHNGHIFYVLMNNEESKFKTLDRMKKAGVHAVFHYVPLHSSPAGKQYCRVGSSMEQTDRIYDGLIRLPLWIDMDLEAQDKVIRVFLDALEGG